MTREPVDLDAIERRAIIAAHDTGCDANCGSDVSTYPPLSKRERAVLEVGLAAVRDAQQRAEQAEQAVARVRDVLAEHWDWKAGRSLHAALSRALDGEAG